MLVLSRRPRQRYRITAPDGAEIWITTLEVDRGKTRHGIDAPKGYTIVREELINKPRDTEAA